MSATSEHAADESSNSLLQALGLHRKELRAWAMYDWANSAFATTMMAAVLPVYFHDVAAADLPEHLRTAYWGYLSGFALLVVAIASPILGAIADSKGNKKTQLFYFMLLGAIGSSLMYNVGHGDWMLACMLFLFAEIGYAGANVFYDSLLPFIARPKEVDRVSTAGFALGYVGGGLLLALNLAWIINPTMWGIPDKGEAVRLSFLCVGIWWFVFSFPLMRHVREPSVGAKVATKVAVRDAFKNLAGTFRDLKRYKQVMIFLIAFWFYTDGIGTIIKMATIYGREVGIGQTHLIGALLLVQFLGIPATFGFGWLASRLGAKPSIMLALTVYAGICILGYFMKEAWQFWALAVLVAMVQGGAQALSRSLYATLIPRSRSSEFFAFISVSARFAGIAGPIMFGLVSQFSGESRISILILISFFVIGIALLGKLDIKEGQRAAHEAEEEFQKHKLALAARFGGIEGGQVDTDSQSPRS